MGQHYLDLYQFKSGGNWEVRGGGCRGSGQRGGCGHSHSPPPSPRPSQWSGIGYLTVFFSFFTFFLSPLILRNFRFDVRPGTQRAFDSASFLDDSSGAGGSTPRRRGAYTAIEDVETAASTTSSLPFKRITLVFSEARAALRGWQCMDSDSLPLRMQITYTVTLKSKEVRPLLRGVSGWCRPGSLTALMGASGAGASGDGRGEESDVGRWEGSRGPLCAPPYALPRCRQDDAHGRHRLPQDRGEAGRRRLPQRHQGHAAHHRAHGGCVRAPSLLLLLQWGG